MVADASTAGTCVAAATGAVMDGASACSKVSSPPPPKKHAVNVRSNSPRNAEKNVRLLINSISLEAEDFCDSG